MCHIEAMQSFGRSISSQRWLHMQQRCTVFKLTCISPKTGRECSGRVAKSDPLCSRTCMRLSIFASCTVSSSSSASRAQQLSICIMMPLEVQTKGIQQAGSCNETEHSLWLLQSILLQSILDGDKPFRKDNKICKHPEQLSIQWTD
jgi:hypothetical protein